MITDIKEKGESDLNIPLNEVQDLRNIFEKCWQRLRNVIDDIPPAVKKYMDDFKADLVKQKESIHSLHQDTMTKVQQWKSPPDVTQMRKDFADIRQRIADGQQAV